MTPDVESATLRRLGRNVAITLTGTGAALGLGVLRTALLAKTLSIDDFGALLILLNAFAFVTLVVSPRVADVFNRYYPELTARGDAPALQALVTGAFLLSAGVGLALAIVALVAAPWIATTGYGLPGLAPLIRIYAIAALLLSLLEFAAPLLRLHDRFRAYVVPHVLGIASTIVLLAIHAGTATRYDLRVIAGIFALGVVLQCSATLVFALRLARPHLRVRWSSEARAAFERYRSGFAATFWHTNLVVLLRNLLSPGGLFLLGILSTTPQVAFFGLAKSLTSGAVRVGQTLQLAAAPEIHHLCARHEYAVARRLARKYLAWTLGLGGALTLLACVLAPWIVRLVATTEYAAALPALYALAVATWLGLPLIVLYPLGVSLDTVRLHATSQLVTVLALAAAALAPGLDATRVALVELTGAVLLLVVFGVPTWMKLHRAAAHVPAPRSTDSPVGGGTG